MDTYDAMVTAIEGINSSMYPDGTNVRITGDFGEDGYTDDVLVNIAYAGAQASGQLIRDLWTVTVMVQSNRILASEAMYALIVRDVIKAVRKAKAFQSVVVLPIERGMRFAEITVLDNSPY